MINLSSEELFKKNEKLVYYCAKKLNPPVQEYEDCLQEGLIELWRVCSNFDESKGNQISTYAIPCIRGVMQRYLREKCNVIKIPRDIFYNDDRDMLEKLTQISSLDFVTTDNGHTLEDIIPDNRNEIDEMISQEDIESTIIEVIRSFKGEYQELFEEFYYDTVFGEKHTTTYYAKKYKHTQSYISRLLNKFRERLREKLEERKNE